MIKEDIVSEVAKAIDLPKHESLRVVDLIVDSIKEILETTPKIEIREFGTFLVVDRKPKLGRIISTGDTVVVPARRAPKFLPGRILKNLVNSQEKVEEKAES
jgi:DNA-binding protein HU-beta